MITYTNEDCMVGMARYPDKYFDLAIVDPPYEQVWGSLQDITSGRKDKMTSFMNKARTWDKKPDASYFEELKRVSKNQIIFGYNYFTKLLGDTNDLIVWDKQITGNKFFLRFEMIYCSFNVSDIVSISSSKTDKIHSCQKPIQIYKHLLTNYAKSGDKILDTHVGSASSLIACHDLGFDAVGFELDPDYYKASKRRLEDFMAQPRIETLHTNEYRQVAIQ